MPLNDLSSALSLLETRRSGRPRDLVAPGPGPADLERMLTIAARTPDHGQLCPFRFVTVEADQRPALAALYADALRSAEPDAPEAKLAKAIANATAAPALLILIFSPIAGHKIPEWEQALTCGAAGMNLLHGGHALGYVGGWITGWPAYDPLVARAFHEPHERIAGLFYFGTPAAPLEERARPLLERIVSTWRP